MNYQVELVRFATDNESIGAIICKRAEQLQASAVVMAKHNKGAIKVGRGGGRAGGAREGSGNEVLVRHGGRRRGTWLESNKGLIKMGHVGRVAAALGWAMGGRRGT